MENEREITLPVHSIFTSISGEAGIFPQGIWCTFIRLQGCNLRCLYCDTAETQSNLTKRPEMSIPEIVKQVSTEKVIITGGEPLIHQHSLVKLIHALRLSGKLVQIETNGSLPLIENDDICYWVVDVKGPSSGQMMSNEKIPIDEFVRQLNNTHSIVKFVIGESDDLYHALDKIHNLHNAGYDGLFIISPVDASPKDAGFIMDTLRMFLLPIVLDRVIFSLQIHKICGFS